MQPTETAAKGQRKPFNILAELFTFTGLMRIGEVADLFGKSTKTIRRMVSKREIPFLRIGRDLRFDPSALILWLSRKDATLAQAARQMGMTF